MDTNDYVDLSIIIPFYNDDKNSISKNIEILSKLNLNYEVLIIDDGSNPPFLINNYKNVSVIRTSNQGVSSARNKGIELSRGKYLFFLDSDDFLTIDFIEFLNNCFNMMVDDWIIFDKVVKTKDKVDKIKIFDSDKISSQIVYEKFITTGLLNECWGKLLKRKFLEDKCIKFNQMINQGEDYLFNITLVLNNASIKYYNIYTYIYIANSWNGDKRFLKDPITGFHSSIECYNMSKNIIYLINDNDVKMRANRIFNSDCINSAAIKLMALYAEKDYNHYKEDFFKYIKTLQIKKISFKDVESKKAKVYLLFFRLNFTIGFRCLSKLRKRHLQKF